MSQMAIYLCKIRNPNSTILEQAINALIKTMDGKQVKKITNDAGRLQNIKPIGTAIRLPTMVYAVDIYITSAGIQFRSDEYCDREMLENLSKQIHQLYLVMAHKAQMEAMGYITGITQNEAGDFILQGVIG